MLVVLVFHLVFSGRKLATSVEILLAWFAMIALLFDLGLCPSVFL